MNCRRLWLIWQEEQSRERFVVGELIRNSGRYILRYKDNITQNNLSEAKAKGFKPHPLFSDLNTLYECKDLFPTFKKRLPPRNRKDFRELVRAKVLKEDSSDFEYLKNTGGMIATDSFSFVEALDENKGEIDFFIAGWRHYEDLNVFDKLKESMELKLERELNNEYDPYAIKIYSTNNELLGYVPVFYSKSLLKYLERNSITVKIKALLPNEPPQRKILVSAKWIPSLDEVAQVIIKNDSFDIFGHKNPDADCIASQFALGHMLQKLDKKVNIVFQFSKTYDWITNEVQYLGNKKSSKGSIAIVLDTANKERVFNFDSSLYNKIINMDHHQDNTMWGDINVVTDDDSMAQILYKLRNKLNEKLDRNKIFLTKELAYYLYISLAADTGSFRYKNTSEKSFLLASLLSKIDINPEEINFNLEANDLKLTRFYGWVMQNLFYDNNISYIIITKNQREDFNITETEAALAIDQIRNIKGVQISVLFVEQNDESFRVRLRSRDVDLTELANRYGGGGHKLACGIILHNSDDIEKIISDAKMIVSNKNVNTTLSEPSI